MRTPSFILLLLMVSLSGCVVTYRDFPNATLESLPKNHEPKPLYYHVEPILTQEVAVKPEQRETMKEVSRLTAGVFTVFSYLYAVIPQLDPIGQPGYQEVARTLSASGMFSDMIEAPDTPETGVYCDVYFEVRERSSWLSAYGGVQSVLLNAPVINVFVAAGVLPYYAGEGGTTVVYSLYRDGQFKSAYRYPITKQGAGWIVLLPFAWLNFLTNDLKDAVHGSTLQFLIDAHRDGCFIGSPNCASSDVAPKALRTPPSTKERGDSGQRIEKSLQPNLKWDAFPGLGEDVTYDLKVWRAKTGWSQLQQGSIVYERQGITQLSHQIEMPLELSTHYLWAVRVHFKRNDQIEITPWSHEMAAGAPDEPRYYHLWTPNSIELQQ
jgi:hypothetical protein